MTFVHSDLYLSTYASRVAPAVGAYQRIPTSVTPAMGHAAIQCPGCVLIPLYELRVVRVTRSRTLIEREEFTTPISVWPADRILFPRRWRILCAPHGRAHAALGQEIRRDAKDLEAPDWPPQARLPDCRAQ